MENFSQALRNFASPRFIVLTVVGVSLLVAFSFLSLRLSEPIMTTLYSNLSADDSSAVVTELGALGVKFEVGGGGSTILVESPEVLRVRMLLAQKGLPGKANIVGYEIFDKESMLGTSNFVMNVNYIRALEGELARTISSLSSIKEARVHLVIPRKDIFKRNNYDPSASVVLTLNNRLDVPKGEAQAVKHIIASSVPGLNPNKVTIVDNNGNVLAKGKGEGDDEDMQSSEAADYKTATEDRFRNNINNMLEQIVGLGKVDTRVTVDMNFQKVSESSERFDPDGAVPRSTQTSETIESSTGAGGEVSVANELTGQGGAGGGGGDNSQKTDEVTNFEISKTITSRVDPGGNVKKVSVAVLVDGKYATDANGAETYTPRTDEELDQIRALVRSAIGFDESRGDRIEVVNMQFSKNNILEQMPAEGAMDWLKRDLDSIIKTVVLGIVAIMTIMLVIRPLVSKAFNMSSADIEAQEIRNMASNEALNQASSNLAGAGGGMGMGSPGIMIGGGNDGMNLDVIQSKIDYSPAQRMNDLIDNNPEASLSIIRTWLAENRA